MANIPLGNFGNVMPQAQAGRVLDTGAGQVAQAVNTLGQVGQQVANEELKKQQKIQDEKDEYAFNIEASKYGAEYTDAVTETKQKLATGEFNEGLAKAHLRQRADELNQSYSERLPDKQKEKFNYYSERTFNEAQAHIKPLAYETERRAINADFEQVTEATLKIGNREQARALYESTVTKNPVLTLEQRTQSLQEWDQRRDLSDAKSVLSTLEDQKDISGLQKLSKGVDTVFPHMKVETRDTYKGQIDSAIDRINKGLEIENRQRDKELEQLSKNFVADAFTGFPLSSSLVNETLTAVKGTKHESEVREAIALNKDAIGFRKLSPIEQERSINRLTSELENTPQDDATLLNKKLNVFQSISAAAKQRSKDDPISSIKAQTGKKLYTVTPEQIGTGQVDFKQAQITTQLLADQKKENGGVGSLIQWNTTERRAFTDRYHDADSKKQAAMLSDLTKMAGNDKAAQKEYFSLLAGDENAMDYVGIARLQQMGIQIPKTKIQIAEIALDGKYLINNHIDGVLGNRKEFNNAVQKEFGNATGIGTTEHIAYQNLAYSIYVGLAKREGSIKADDKGNPMINPVMAKRAFDMATGGTYKQSLGKNTQTVFMPYGFTQGSFEDALEESLRVTYRKETGFLPPSENLLKTHAVVPVPNKQGQYKLIRPDGKVFKNPKTAQDYIIKISK